MAPVDIRPPGYISQGTFSGSIPGEKGIERRRRLAEVLAARGTETTPVQHWTQAAARVANSLAGALGNYQAGQMEQQRYKALGEAMRSGMTPEQLYGTGDESLMNYAKFKLQMDQQKVEADRQAEMLRLAQAQDTREASAATQKTQPQFRQPTPEEQQQYPGADFIDPIQGPHYPPRAPAANISPLDRQTQIEQAKADADRAGRVEGAKAFLQKVGRVEAQIGQADKEGNFVSGNEDLFGPFQSNQYWRQGAAVLGTESESQRTTLESDLSDLELDVARMKLKGTGPISNEERMIARRTLPQLSNQDARTAWNTLQQRKAEALDLINGAAGPKLEVPITTPRGQPQQHPMQGAPPPQPNVRAGEVPLPRTMGTVDTGNGPPPLPQIMTPADYASLQSGQHFLDPEGNERVKP